MKPVALYCEFCTSYGDFDLLFLVNFCFKIVGA